ncbi:MAG: N-acetylmuramoyl-L-alanine amidase [Oscillospiraceae bacterium]|nr:N-acetylmuramoyl-L-alanine amidase [Oscillospiraceae bacterium]
MKKHWKQKLAALLTAAVLLAGLSVPAAGAEPAASADKNDGAIHGLMVRTRNNQDFPTRAGLSSGELIAEIDRIVFFASQNGYDTIFYEARPCGDAMYRSTYYPNSEFWTGEQGKMVLMFDPMDYLMKASRAAGLQVYAVVDPYLVAVSSEKAKTLSISNPATKIPQMAASTASGALYLNPGDDGAKAIITAGIKEIVSKYKVDGVLLENFAYPDASLKDAETYEQNGEGRTLSEFRQDSLYNLLARINSEVKSISSDTQLGVLMDYSWEDLQLSKTSAAAFAGEADPERWLGDRLLDFIMPQISCPVESETYDYETEAAAWKALADRYGAQVITLNQPNRVLSPTADQLFYKDPYEISSQLYINQKLGIQSSAMLSYSGLKGNLHNQAVNIMGMFSGASFLPDGYSLDISKNFAITRPNSAITVSTDSYYILGTSNPELPLSFDGEPVERLGRSGVFGVLVDVKVGANLYTFQQGGRTETVSINRPDPAATVSPSPITKIVQSSMFPAQAEPAFAGEEVTFRCTAPAGASVQVTAGGVTAVLAQAAYAAPGVPAVFSKTVLWPDNPSAETVKTGSAVYTLTYGGSTSTYTSTGELYTVGQNAKLAVSCNDYLNNVYGDVSVEDDFYMALPQGACDTVTENLQSYYKLSSGGYLPKSTADILEGSGNVANRVSDVNFYAEEKGEKFVLSGTSRPVFTARMDDGSLTVKLFNTSKVPASLGPYDSELISSLARSEGSDGSTTLRFHLLSGVRLWGYSVEYDGNDTVIYLKKAPVLSGAYAKPLTGMTIVLDAGHGGEDPGALGPAGSEGPAERELNYAAAWAAKQRLEQLGAEVILVNPEDERLSFEERMDPARAARADFFLSFHHNSTAESVDSSQSSGTEIYYHEEQSRLFAEKVSQALYQATGRPQKGAIQSYYRVTRMTYAPSLLLELGFVTNPAEFEALCEPLNILRTSYAVSDAVIGTVTAFQNPARDTSGDRVQNLNA